MMGMSHDWRDSYDTIRVWQRTQTSTDAYNEPVYAWTYTDVRGVSIRHVAATALEVGDSASDVRPDGIRVKYTLALPRGHGLSLRGARVTIPAYGQTATTWEDAKGYALLVSGDPLPMQAPTQWDTLVHVGRVDG